MGNPHISIRKHICWDPKHGGKPLEPTSTVVLTTSKNYYVDIRILKDAETNQDSAALKEESLDKIDWAFAGTSAELESPTPGNSSTVVEWTHWIDSKHTGGGDGELPRDVGRLYPPQANGDTLETGRMENPKTGVETDYEELWGSVDVKSILKQGGEGAKKVSAVLQTLGSASLGSCKGMIVRVGQFVQGILVRDGHLALERWEHDGEQWKCGIRVGSPKLLLPCTKLFDPVTFAEGDQVDHYGLEWQVLEMHEHI